jgi:hypothetical protein
MGESLTAVREMGEELASIKEQFAEFKSSTVSVLQLADLRAELRKVGGDVQGFREESRASADEAARVGANANALLAGEVESIRGALGLVKRDCERRVTAVTRDVASSKTATAASVGSLGEELAKLTEKVAHMLEEVHRPPAVVAELQWQVSFAKSAVREFGWTLAEWFGVPTDLRLLYSAAGSEKFCACDWRWACRGVGPTLTVVMFHRKDVLCAIGGYTPLPWAYADGSVKDPSGKTAIFALKNTRGDVPYLLRNKPSGTAMFCDTGVPYFGDDGGFAFGWSPGRCTAFVPNASNWSACPGRAVELGLAEDGHVEWAWFVHFETWKW